MTAPSPTPSERLRALADDARLFWNGHTPALRYVEPDDVRAIASAVAALEGERDRLREEIEVERRAAVVRHEARASWNAALGGWITEATAHNIALDFAEGDAGRVMRWLDAEDVAVCKTDPDGSTRPAILDERDALREERDRLREAAQFRASLEADGEPGDRLPGMNEHPRYLSTSEVARRLRLSVERVRQLARSGALPPDCENDLGWKLWSPETVDAFAKTRGPWGRFDRRRGGEPG